MLKRSRGECASPSEKWDLQLKSISVEDETKFFGLDIQILETLLYMLYRPLMH